MHANRQRARWVGRRGARA